VSTESRLIAGPEELRRDSFDATGWVYREWDDGVQQWVNLKNYLEECPKQDYLVERVAGEKSKRKQWYVVNRHDDDEGDKWCFGRYPPKVAGPFPNPESAKLALLLLLG
jgi:hypothetical protein